MSASEEEKKSYFPKTEEKQLFCKAERKTKLSSQKRKQNKTYFTKTETKTNLFYKNGNIFFLFCQSESKKTYCGASCDAFVLEQLMEQGKAVR